MNSDLEPIELETIAVEPPDALPRVPRRPRWGWIVVVVVLGAVIAVAGVGRAHHRRPVDVTTATVLAHLRGTVPGNFAAVLDSGVYIFNGDSKNPRRVRLANDDAILGQSGNSVLVQLDNNKAIVNTRTLHITKVPNDRTPIAALEPGHWWYVGAHDVRSDAGKDVAVPDGLTILSAVDSGFLATTSVGDFVIWDTVATHPFVRPAGPVFVSNHATVVTRNPCNAFECAIDYARVDGSIGGHMALGVIPESGALAPDGTRLALVTTFGDVVFIDLSTGERTTALVAGRGESPTHRTLSWSPDGKTIVVAQRNQFIVLRASDGQAMSIVNGPEMLQQIVLLP